MQQFAMLCLRAGIALMAFVSLHPYFMWGQQKVYYAAASVLVVLSAAMCHRHFVADRNGWILALAFSMFLVYLSVLPKVDGGTTRWFFLIPFTAATLLLRREQLKAAFHSFYWIFSLSLVPGILVWLWVVAGLPIEMRFTAPPGDIVQRGVTEYLELPGATFLLSNGIVLPHGGVLFRLCGIYDEPGTVGTIAALCLAASGYRLRTIPGAIAFVAGLMSLSVAFALLTGLGLLATAILERRVWLAVALPAVALAAAIPLSGLKFEGVPPSTVTMYRPLEAASSPLHAPHVRWSPPSLEPGERQLFATDTKVLRVAPGLEGRAHPWMRKLLDDYLGSRMRVLLFGIASNASLIHGWGSSIWYRILTDFGMVGFVWLFGLFAYPLWRLWREGKLDAPVVIFCALFLMSFYQRPIIWLPAQLLLYLAGLYIPKKSTKP